MERRHEENTFVVSERYATSMILELKIKYCLRFEYYRGVKNDFWYVGAQDVRQNSGRQFYLKNVRCCWKRMFLNSAKKPSILHETSAQEFA